MDELWQLLRRGETSFDQDEEDEDLEEESKKQPKTHTQCCH
jgi:hypothetical protein